MPTLAEEKATLQADLGTLLQAVDQRKRSFVLPAFTRLQTFIADIDTDQVPTVVEPPPPPPEAPPPAKKVKM